MNIRAPLTSVVLVAAGALVLGAVGGVYYLMRSTGRAVRAASTPASQSPAHHEEGAATVHPGREAVPFGRAPADAGAEVEARPLAESTIEEGREARLVVPGADLVIPADALSPGTVVTLSVGPLDDPSFPERDLPNVCSQVASVTWSTTQRARPTMRLSVEVPPGPRVFFVRQKTEGNPLFPSHPDRGWMREFVNWDGTTNRVIVELGATATQSSFVAICTSGRRGSK